MVLALLLSYCLHCIATAPCLWYLGFEVQQLRPKIYRATPSSTTCLPVLGQRDPRCVSHPKLHSHSQQKHPGAQELLHQHVHHDPTTHAVKCTQPQRRLKCQLPPWEMESRREHVHTSTFRDHSSFSMFLPILEQLRPWQTLIIKQQIYESTFEYRHGQRVYLTYDLRLRLSPDECEAGGDI